MKSSPFQIGVIMFFSIAIVLALLIFTGVIGGGDKSKQSSVTGNVTIWGTYPTEIISKLISDFNAANQEYSVNYIPVLSGELNTKLAEAIASGVGPDIVVLNQEEILKNQSKLYTIPYESLPEATFRSTFIGGGELFMVPQGVIGLPLTVDPLVMYYNRDLLEASGITLPPQTWNDIVKITPLLTKKDVNFNIIQSSIPFGIYSNVNNAADILSLLLFQAGNPIVSKENGVFRPVLGFTTTSNTSSQIVSPAVSVVDFFTQFVDPTKDTYTWNRSFKNARTEFITGKLAMYIGYASELPSIVAQNPNLNFNIAKVPQSGLTGTQITFGRVDALAVVKASRNLSTALVVASKLTDADFASKLVESLTVVAPVAPARRDLLAKVPQNVFAPTLYSSAIISRGWYSLGKDVVNPIFNTMIDNVVRGVSNSTQAVSDAQNKLTNLYGN